VIDLDALLEANGGLLLASHLRRRKSSLSRWCKAGRLVRLLPGVYAHPGAVADLPTRLRAVLARIPDAVIAGAAAARLTAWLQEQVGEIDVITPGRRVSRPGFGMVRRRLSPSHVLRRGKLSILSPELVAVDAAARDSGERIDHLLRARYPLARIEAALAECPGRPGNRARRRVVHRSRSLPWSQAERLFHDMLDRNGVKGWVANATVRIGDASYAPDVGFGATPVACEVDGYEHHSSREAFTRDRQRQNALVLAGWTVLRFSWDMLADEKAVVTAVRAAVRARSSIRPARAG
jgi:very-short-patch-repair endonuclease